MIVSQNNTWQVGRDGHASLELNILRRKDCR